MKLAAEYAYFFFYSIVRTSYMKRLAAKRPAGSAAAPLSTAAELALGAVAGALAQIFTIPVSVSNLFTSHHRNLSASPHSTCYSCLSTRTPRSAWMLSTPP